MYNMIGGGAVDSSFGPVPATNTTVFLKMLPCIDNSGFHVFGGLAGKRSGINVSTCGKVGRGHMPPPPQRCLKTCFILLGWARSNTSWGRSSNSNKLSGNEAQSQQLRNWFEAFLGRSWAYQRPALYWDLCFIRIPPLHHKQNHKKHACWLMFDNSSFISHACSSLLRNRL